MSNENLALLAQQGDASALLALWSSVKRFAFRQAQRWYHGYGVVGTDDYEQSAFLALVDSVARYNPDGGTFISVFARRLSTEFRIAKYGGRSVKTMSDPLLSALSIDASMDDDEDGGSFADLIPDESAERAFEALERAELSNAVKKTLDALDGAEMQVIDCRFYAAMTREKTAQALNISVSEAQKLEASALRKLRHPSVSLSLRQFL